MAKTDKLTVRVATLGIPTRRRAGLVLTPTPKIFTVTPEQLAALKADVGLSVVPIVGGDTATAADLAEATAAADRHLAESIRLRRHLDAALAQLAEAGIEFVAPPADSDFEIVDNGEEEFGGSPSKDGGDTAPRSARRRAPRDGAVRTEIG